MSAWIDLAPTDTVERPMLYAIAASTTLIFVLAVPRSARARRRLARLLRAQEVWAELIDRESQPRQECSLAAPWRGPRKEDDPAILRAEDPALAVLLSGQPDGRHRA